MGLRNLWVFLTISLTYRYLAGNQDLSLISRSPAHFFPSTDPCAGRRRKAVSHPHPILPHLPKENLILRRAYFSAVFPFQYSPSLLKVIVNETRVSSCYPPFPPGYRSDQIIQMLSSGAIKLRSWTQEGTIWSWFIKSLP
jgi:hypothetical protein